MGEQSELYKKVQQVDRIHDLVGGDLARDGLKVILQEQDAAALVVDVRNLPEPLTTTLNEALASVGGDEVRVTPTETLPVEQQSPVAIEDTNGDRQDPATQQTLSSLASKAATEETLASLDGKAATEETLAALASALGSDGGDALRITPTAALDVSAATVTVTDDGSLAVSQTPLDAALASDGTDTLQVEQQGVVDVSSRDSRNLGSVDVSDLPDADYTEAWGADLAADGANEYAPTAVGADALDGRVRSSGTYDATLEWQDSQGNVVESVDLGTGVAADTWTDVSGETAITPYPVVRVTDTSAAAQTTDAALHLR